MGKSKQAKLPKTKCCVSSTKCGRCPLRMLKEGTLPAGYTVKKRRLVVRAPDGTFVPVPKQKKGKKGALPPVTTLATGAKAHKKSAQKAGGKKKKLAAAA